MKRTKTIAMLVAVAALAAAGCSSDSSSTTAKGVTVNVEVRDVKDAPWTLTDAPSTVPAGKVTFTVKNAGTIEHEVVILKTDTPYDKLPVGSGGRVSEDESVGEVSEFAAGATDSVTLDLTPGKYVLLCNIAAHYGKGMTAALTVT